MLLLTVDQLVEGRHFEPDTPVDLVARKAVARSVSDIAAMGGRPSWALATAALPDRYTHADELFDAMARWARHWHCPLIGGDIAFAPGPLSLGVTVCGRMEPGSEPLLRSGARVGDELWLTGPIGASLESGWHLRFEPRVEAGAAAAASGIVHAAIDLSDGLGRDAARVGAASGVRLEIDAGRLPMRERGLDWTLAVRQGEDYELLLAVGPHRTETGALPLRAEPELVGPVGRVRSCRAGELPGATIIDTDGREHDAGEMGWDHGG
ncbi:MAG: thiamine-phosphate kinase [Phycisphaerales bacterium]